MKIYFNFKNKKLELDVKPSGIYGFGLMFKSKNTKPLLFEFKKIVNLRITSLFVFFSFVAVWLDKKNNVVDIKLVKPFTFSVKPKKSFSKIIEIPVTENNSKIIKLLVGN